MELEKIKKRISNQLDLLILHTSGLLNSSTIRLYAMESFCPELLYILYSGYWTDSGIYYKFHLSFLEWNLEIWEKAVNDFYKEIRRIPMKFKEENGESYYGILFL